MKRLAIAVPFLLIVIIAAALIVPSFVDWNSYKDQIQTEVKKQTDLDLALVGDLRLGVLPYPRLIAESISLKTAEKRKYDGLLNLKRLEIGLNLVPLLSGNISVSSVTLVEPKIKLEVLEDGTILGMAPKIGEQQIEAKTSAAASIAVPDISFDQIQIEDAMFSLYDHKSKAETIVDGVSGTLSAETIYGPYKGKGALLYQGRILSFDLSSRGFDAKTKILSLEAQIMAQPGNIAAKFAGALDFSKDFVAQGQIELALESLGKTLVANNLAQEGAFGNEPALIKGFLNTSSKKLEIKELEGDIAGQKIAGSIATELEPFAVTANLKTTKDVNLQSFVTGYPSLKTGSFDLALSGDASSIGISKGAIGINSETYQVSGKYVFENKTGRPELNIALAGKSFDFSNFENEENKKNNLKTEGYVKNLNKPIEIDMPFDLVFFADFDSLFYQKEKLSKVRASGRMEQNSVILTSLSVGAFKSSDLALTGEIKSLRDLDGVTVSGVVSTKDAAGLLSFLGTDAGVVPADVNTGSVKFKFSGNKKTMDATVNLSAANGDVIAQGKVTNLLESPQLQSLSIQVKHRSMDEAIRIFSKSEQKNSEFSKPLDFFANVQKSEDGSYVLSDMKGDLSGILMQGDATIKMSEAKPYLKGDLRFEDVVLSGQSSGGSKSGGSSKSQSASQRWSKETMDLSALNSINADLNITAKKIAYDPWVFLRPTTTISLNEGVLSIKDFNAKLFDGDIALTSTVETAPQPRQPVHISLSAKTANVDLGAMLQALAGNLPLKASGRTNADIEFKTSGLSAAALVYDLNGKGTLTGSSIILEGVDVERFAAALSDESKPGDSAMSLWKGVSKGGNTAFDTLDGVFDITEGIVGIQKLDLDGPQASIFTTGKVDLPNWTLSTKHKLTAKTRKDVPPFEMAFSGPLDNPAQTFGQGVLNDYLQRKLQRKLGKMVGEKLGLPTQQPSVQDITPAADGEETAPETQQTETAPAQKSFEDMKPEDAIKDVLKGILQ